MANQKSLQNLVIHVVMKTYLIHSTEVLWQQNNSLQYFNCLSKVLHIAEHISETSAVKSLLALQYSV